MYSFVIETITAYFNDMQNLAGPIKLVVVSECMHTVEC